jgi:hypothetical protein
MVHQCYSNLTIFDLGPWHDSGKENGTGALHWDRLATWMSPVEPAHGCALFGVSQRSAPVSFSAIEGKNDSNELMNSLNRL